MSGASKLSPSVVYVPESEGHGVSMAYFVLGLFLLIDITLISINWHIGGTIAGMDFNIQRDGSIPEYFNYFKWLVGFAACATLYFKKRDALFLVWCSLFAYFLIDDSQGIHEQISGPLATAFNWSPALGLRAKDFGELFVSSAVGVMLLGLMAFCYSYHARNGRGSESRAFTRQQLPWLGLLIFCGVVVDMLHQQVGTAGFPFLSRIFGFIEDGGEMIAASFLAAISIIYAMSRQPLRRFIFAPLFRLTIPDFRYRFHL